MRVWLLILGLLLINACQDQSETPHLESPTPVFHADQNPKTLSQWGQVTSDGKTLKLADTALIYDLNTPLFSDYSLKLRTVWMPEGVSAVYENKDVFEFPIGTVITKTFYYPRGNVPDIVAKTEGVPDIRDQSLNLKQYRLIETRILAHRQEGWIALPYVWNEDQSEAILQRVGDIKTLTLDDGGIQTEFAYIIPNTNQCAGCHATNNTTREILPIGPKARHLNSADGKDQLSQWIAAGYLTALPDATIPKAVKWNDPNQPLSARARAYLDINCAHCHSRVGPADTSGLHLEADTPMGASLGLCKLPIAAGTGTGDRKFGIVPGEPDASIFVYRMASTNPAVMMPELGRSLAHTEGVKLLSDWIAAMDGECG